MLRVAHVLNSPGRGGVPRVVDALVRHADANRIAPHVFHMKASDGPDLMADLNIPRRTANSGSKAAAMTELITFLDHHKIDILHTHSYRPNVYGRMAGAVLRPAGLKIVAHYHNDYSDKWDAETLCVERQLAAVTDAGIAVSAAVAGRVAECVGKVCDVAENGIDRARVTGGNRARGRAALGVPMDACLVGLVGRVCRQKGIDTFVAAATMTARERPNARFVVIGDAEDNDLLSRMTTRITEAGLTDRIHFAGHRDDMADMLAALDLLAAPSRWEGFGLMLAEAMAAGVPVIGSMVGGIPDVLGDAGLLVPAEEPKALSRAMTTLLGHTTRKADMAQLGQRQSARFDWTRTAFLICSIYERITRTA
ncbi:MAG: glycosyltransferase family 4 protein [Rhodobacteraceae bacterium]|nr:glycosyltransferase family 4 protein [Paracoccaceae bacterium]